MPLSLKLNLLADDTLLSVDNLISGNDMERSWMSTIYFKEGVGNCLRVVISPPTDLMPLQGGGFHRTLHRP